MSRKPKKGYFVRGQFVAAGSPLDEEFQRELKGGLEGPSKTQRKQESQALQDMGDELLVLRSDLFESLSLPDSLIDALQQAKRISNFEGKRRQMQYVGKLMRKLDSATVEAIESALQMQRMGHAHDVDVLHEAEQWRERLLRDDQALADWLSERPGSDSQSLRALIRQARKDAVAVTQSQMSQGQAPRQNRAYRELFQYLRTQLQQTSSTPAAPDDTEI